MKINSIGIYAPRRTQTTQPSAAKGYSNINSVQYGTDSFSRTAHAPSPVSFGMHLAWIQNAPHVLHCPCCGRKMVPQSILKSLNNIPHFMANIKTGVIKKLTPLERNKRMFNILSPYKESMYPVEKNVFSKLEKMHLESPEKSIKEFMAEMRPSHLVSLNAHQSKILNEIDARALELPQESRTQVKDLIKETRDILTKEFEEITKTVTQPDKFKRKVFIRKLEALNIGGENKIIKSILELANELPKSQNNTSAFIVKYSGKVAKTVDDGMVRELPTSEIIAKVLLERAAETIEHLRPQNPLYGLPKGLSDPANTVLECAGDNGPLGNWTLREKVQEMPQMIQNAQIHINELIDYSNSGKIKNLEEYIIGLAQTMERESRELRYIEQEKVAPENLGLLRLDISKLKRIPENQTYA